MDVISLDMISYKYRSYYDETGIIITIHSTSTCKSNTNIFTVCGGFVLFQCLENNIIYGW